MARELIQARADEDTVEELEEHAEEKGISRSEAIRRLIRRGLEAQDEPDEATDGEIHRAASGQVIPLVIIILLLANLAVSLGVV